MKILELEYRGPPALGGVETNVIETSKWFKEKGHEVEIWSTDLLDFAGQKDSQLERVVENIRVRKFRSFRFPAILLFICPIIHRSIYPGMLFKLFKLRGRQDIAVHSHSFPSFHSYLALFFHRKFRGTVITPHFDTEDLIKYTASFPWNWPFRFLKYFVNKRSDIYLSADTRREKEAYVNTLGFDEQKVLVIPNGVNLEEFDPITSEEIYEIKREYGLERTFNVLFAGRVAPGKGINLLIQAIAKLNNADIRLVVAGPDFGALADLRELSQRLELTDKVIFTGVLERRKFCATIKTCDVLVLPSYGGESFGIVLTEAMACGKPVIGSRTGGIAELIQEGENGFLFDIGSVEQLAEKIDLLYRDRNLYRELGEEGRRIVADNYTWEKVANMYLKLWESIS